MKVHWDSSALGRTKWHEYALRFAIGGAITALAGVIAKSFGATIGGLFLAFPATFPAGATLIEKHEKQKKIRAGLSPGDRGKDAAALDAEGAAMGSIALLVFAVLVWKFLPRHAGLVITLSTIAWITVSVAIRRLFEYL
jgi:hypothetical protein